MVDKYFDSRNLVQSNNNNDNNNYLSSGLILQALFIELHIY